MHKTHPMLTTSRISLDLLLLPHHIPVTGEPQTLLQTDTPEFSNKGRGRGRTLDLLPTSFHVENAQLHLLGIIRWARGWFHFASFQGYISQPTLSPFTPALFQSFPTHFFPSPADDSRSGRSQEVSPISQRRPSLLLNTL